MVGINFGKTTIVKDKEALDREMKLRNKFNKPVTKEAIEETMKKLNIPNKKQL